MLVGCDCAMQIRHKVAGEHISFFLPQNPFTLSSDDVRLVSGAEGGWYSCWCIQMFLVHRVLSIYINWAWRIGELIHICITPRKSWERERESPNHANICADMSNISQEHPALAHYKVSGNNKIARFYFILLRFPTPSNRDTKTMQ